MATFRRSGQSLPTLASVSFSVADQRAIRIVGLTRISVAMFVVFVLLLTFVGRISVGDANPFDYFGYFTNQTSLLTSSVLIATGALMAVGRSVPTWLMTTRGVAAACLVIVAVIYNTLVPGTGTAPAWVSAILHVCFPLYVVVDWMIVGDRPPLPWSRLWIVLPYPLCWLMVVLLRGATDGWVPYGFLLPERGALSLIGHSLSLFLALLAAGAAVWAGSRMRGLILRDRVVASSPD